jgi:hypothetical protein
MDREKRARGGVWVFPLCGALFFFWILPSAFARDLSVLVEDAEFALPLEGAALTLPDGSVVACDSAGRAVVALDGGERVFVQVSYPGYTGITVRVAPGDTFIRVSLSSRDGAVRENRELVFEERRRSAARGEAGTSVALPEKERAMASEIGLAEDVLSSIKLLPGVGYAGMFNAQPSLRGGDPGDVTAVFDGFYLKKPYHWDGGFSIFAPQMVKSALLSHGVFSARYGWTVSGILEVSSRAPPEYAALEIGVSTNTFQSALSFPAKKGGVSLFGRFSYWDGYFAIAKALAKSVTALEPADAITKAPFINSAALSAYYQWMPYCTIQLDGYAGHDGVIVRYQPYDAMAALIYKENVGLLYNWSNFIGFIKTGLTVEPSPRTMIKAALGAGYDALSVTHESISEVEEGWIDIREEPHMALQFNAECAWQIHDTILLSAGVEEIPQQWRTKRHGKTGQADWQYAPDQYRQVSAYYPDVDNRALFSAFWSTAEWNPAGKRYSAEAGLRAGHIYLITDNTAVNTAPVVQPRVTVRYELFSKTRLVDSFTVSAGTGFFSTMDDAAVLEDSKTGLLSFEQTKSWTSVAAAHIDFTGGLGIAIEAYYKKITNHPYRVFSLLDEETAWYVSRFDGFGRVFGVDLMLKKFEGRVLSGWLSYSFNNVRYNNPHGAEAYRGASFAPDSDKWYYPEYHRFHTLNLVLNCSVSRRVRLYTRLGFATGTPKPLYLSSAYQVQNRGGSVSTRYRNDSLYSDEKRDAFRLPLDIKFSFSFYKRAGKTQADFYIAGENLLVFFLPKSESMLFDSNTGVFHAGSERAIYEVQIPMLSFGVTWSY